MDKNINALIKMFKINGKVIDAKRYGNGHINVTYLVTTTKDKYILQDINTNAFKDVNLLMNNIDIVAKHIKNKGEQSIELVSTFDDKLYCEYNGEYLQDVVCHGEGTTKLVEYKEDGGKRILTIEGEYIDGETIIDDYESITRI